MLTPVWPIFVLVHLSYGAGQDTVGFEKAIVHFAVKFINQQQVNCQVQV